MSAGRRISRKVLNIVYGLISGVMTLGAGHQEMIPHRYTSDISGWSPVTGHPARHHNMEIWKYFALDHVYVGNFLMMFVSAEIVDTGCVWNI